MASLETTALLASDNDNDDDDDDALFSSTLLSLLSPSPQQHHDDCGDETTTETTTTSKRSTIQQTTTMTMILLLSSIIITTIILIPTLLGSIMFLYSMTNRLYPSTIHSFHITISLLLISSSILLLASFKHSTYNKQPSSSSRKRKATRTYFVKTLALLLLLISSIILDISLFWFVYPSMFHIYEYSFLDIDGTIIVDWENDHKQLLWIQFGMNCIISLRIIQLLFMIIGYCLIWIYNQKTKNQRQQQHQTSTTTTTTTCIGIGCCFPPKLLVDVSSWITRTTKFQQHKLQPKRRRRRRPFILCNVQFLRIFFIVMTILSLVPLGLCIRSCRQYIWSSQQENDIDTTTTTMTLLRRSSNGCCDDLDPTECALPFPSFHHMRIDDLNTNSKTGYKVNLQGNILPKMKSGMIADFTFLNDLDGFSPMAPILFYLPGIKESQEAIYHGIKSSSYLPSLPYKWEDSITSKSITILWDVKGQNLVPHTSRVDYLDPMKPIILLVPSKPLNHATHYAVAVVNATNTYGQLLNMTLGMQQLNFAASQNETWMSSKCSLDIHRLERYQHVLLPSLQQAAPWVSLPSSLFHHDNETDDDQQQQPSLSLFPSSLQLMFDFVTMSNDSIQPVRTIRDATLKEISSSNYQHKIQITKIINGNCHNNNNNNTKHNLIARTIHGSIQVPWWLESDRRDAILSSKSLAERKSNGYGEAKFVMYVPCSLEAAAINSTIRQQRPLRAIVEYGHGLFYNRAEAGEYSLLRVAEDQGYLVMALDWRGMSSFDMPVVIKSLLATPKFFQATRDNLIQGYVGKLVLQHYSQNGGLLEEDWLQFTTTTSSSTNNSTYSSIYNETTTKYNNQIPTYNDSTAPISVFYGSSQGGILGAAYTALLGPTGLIERGILGTPGTSFSLIEYKSTSFSFYDTLLKQNFYNNRQIRILVSIFQLAWDPATTSSILAPPITEAYPPMLIQSGLGDPVIPTIATEALARAYNATILPNNPRTEIFGISKVVAAACNDPTNRFNGTGCIVEGDEQPYVTWTELLYEEEYRMTPINNFVDLNTRHQNQNDAHPCLRQDCALIGQMAMFINTGQIIDPCLKDQCLRRTIPCYRKGQHGNTKLSNWTCDYYGQCKSGL